MKIATVYNGDVFDKSIFPKARALSGCDGLMVARAAQWNPSVFADAYERIDTVAALYAAVAAAVGSVPANTRYGLQGMMKGRYCRSDAFAMISSAKTDGDIRKGLERFSEEIGEKGRSEGCGYDFLTCNREVETSYFLNNG